MPRHSRLRIELFLVSTLLLYCVQTEWAYAAESKSASVTSPDGRLRATVTLQTTANHDSVLVYEVFFQGKFVVLPSALELKLADGTTLGRQCKLVKSESREISDRFRQFPGKSQFVEDRCNELILTLTENVEPARDWQVIVRAYDDGIALRYVFPKQTHWQEFELASENTHFAFPANASAVFLPLPGFLTSHENHYQRKPLAEIPAKQLLDVPFLVELPGIGWAAVAEANLTNYAGMFLSRAEGDTTLVSTLSPRVDRPEIAVQSALPMETPWRVLLFAKDAKSLIESDLLLKVNAPSVIDNVSWIKPGQTTFPWWNGYFEEGVSFKPGVNTATAKHYIDFCAEYGIPYHSLDGLGNTAWYGGPIVPYEGDDPTTAVEGLDLAEVLAYAEKKGVKLRLWMHWQAAQAHMKRAFPLYHQLGIEGVMIDFMDRNDQEMINFQRELLQLAADNQLTVNLHGAAPPTGLERTFPNLLNTEAVMNLEYNKWDQHGIPPEHDVTVPFTRMIAGPLDYHQGSLRTVTLEKFRPQEAAPLVIGTPCRTLASYVVLQNHLPMLADYPSAYRRHPLTRVLTEIPATWDETRAIVGEVGQYVAIARRAGDEWWIGVMTDSEPRDLELPLDFLDEENYRAEIYQDDLTAPQQFSRTVSDVSAASTLSISLAKAGGALVHLTPLPTTPPGWQLVWSDEFDQLDQGKWHVGDDFLLPIRDQHKVVSASVSVKDGNLMLESHSDAESDNSVYRLNRVVSKQAQQFGRWEIRAQIPSGTGISSMIRLLPEAPWPSRGEIDIMTNQGSQPTMTNSEFQWGSNDPHSHANRVIPQQASQGGQLISFPAGFHTYAVEWTPDQLRFFVDDVHHTTFYSDEVGDFLPKLVLPMHLSIDGNAGDGATPSKETKMPSQELLIDWVRVYEPDSSSTSRRLVNGNFEKQGGSLAGWHVFGNRLTDEPNVLPSWQHSRHGTWSLDLSGQSSDDENYSGVSQGISVSPGQLVQAKLYARISSDSSLSGTDNRATMKIEFYNQIGDYFGGPAMLAVKEIVIGDHSSAVDEWQKHELSILAPSGAVEARLSLVFAQLENQPGTIYIDDVEFAASNSQVP
ncbi:MAG: glycoside hydrolase family 97 catalytic domain-containing protein [Bythopirellula sp.]|nr:glycoside hydrolase family 97 catalytic domain-containing protein [Bythopirellula sp.]